MKIFIINNKDVARLRAYLKQDPKHTTLNQEELELYGSVFRQINYHVETWINEITKDE